MPFWVQNVDHFDVDKHSVTMHARTFGCKTRIFINNYGLEKFFLRAQLTNFTDSYTQTHLLLQVYHFDIDRHWVHSRTSFAYKIRHFYRWTKIMDLWSNVMISFSNYCLWTPKKRDKNKYYSRSGHFSLHHEPRKLIKRMRSWDKNKNYNAYN